MWDVFISHAREDKDLVARPLAEELKKCGLKVWYDEYTLRVGDSLRRQIDEGLANSQFGIVILSNSFFAKEWPNIELDGLAARQSASGQKVILPVWHEVCLEDVLKYSPPLAGLLAAKTSAGIPNVTKELLAVIQRTAKQSPVVHSGQKRQHLCERIDEKQWRLIEQAATKAITVGGMAAMAYYRQATTWPTGLPSPNSADKNPLTPADLEATAAVLQSIEAYLSPLARELGSSLMFLAEETSYLEWFRTNISQNAFQCIKTSEQFFTPQDMSIRVIVDGIDGTGSFVRGIPLFCSGLAVLIGDQPRVSAVYDPIHHSVYSAVLMGPHQNPNAHSRAFSWHVATGNRVDLVQRARETQQIPLRQSAIGLHLTRTKQPKLEEFLRPNSASPSMIERIAKAVGATYALNSGILALTYVADGALGGFVNNVTNLWDVAAGEPLVQACRGKITQFDGAQIDYSYPHLVSVVAAKEHLHSQLLDTLR